ncbi:hypothetical protein BLNAU_19715 [Blattamonas nauphoetae]|uniref:Uncharacterized protein n=1 Tax=Blattamonas nauphoetae TaxID=2049346 RepID=A0ABQ9X4Z1_9EUKA|nr:hypothetical protein BLNAU_19715 [Blattamonas nauphoetae]
MLSLRVPSNQHDSQSPPHICTSSLFSPALLGHPIHRLFSIIHQSQHTLIHVTLSTPSLHRRNRKTRPITKPLIQPSLNDTLHIHPRHPRRMDPRNDCCLPQPAIDNAFFFPPLHHPCPFRMSMEARSSSFSHRSSTYHRFLLPCCHPTRWTSGVAVEQFGCHRQL